MMTKKSRRYCLLFSRSLESSTAPPSCASHGVWWSLTSLCLFLFFFQYGDPSTVFYDSSNGGDIQAVLNQVIAAGMTCLVLAKCRYTYSGQFLPLQKPIKICGQGIGETILDGFGLIIRGSKSNGSVVVEDLSIQGGTGNGLHAQNGMDLIVRRCKVEKFLRHGVDAQNAHISCDDVQVVGCGWNGVLAQSSATASCESSGTVKLSGENTRIEGNVTCGSSGHNGLYAYSTSKIQIVAPLTKETISINNRGGRNWGGPGTIEQVKQVKINFTWNGRKIKKKSVRTGMSGRLL